jgi:hypothetical protein
LAPSARPRVDQQFGRSCSRAASSSSRSSQQLLKLLQYVRGVVSSAVEYTWPQQQQQQHTRAAATPAVAAIWRCWSAGALEVLVAVAAEAGHVCCAVMDPMCVQVCSPELRVCAAHGELPHSVACALLVGGNSAASVGFLLACSCCVSGHCKVVLGCSMCLASFLSFRCSLKGSTSTVSDRSSSRALGWQHGRCRQRPYTPTC